MSLTELMENHPVQTKQGIVEHRLSEKAYYIMPDTCGPEGHQELYEIGENYEPWGSKGVVVVPLALSEGGKEATGQCVEHILIPEDAHFSLEKGNPSLISVVEKDLKARGWTLQSREG